MAFRISRRAKYLVVLAFISVCLYGSLGTDKLGSINPAAYPIHLPSLDQISSSKIFGATDDIEYEKFPDQESILVDITAEILPEKPAVEYAAPDRSDTISQDKVTSPGKVPLDDELAIEVEDSVTGTETVAVGAGPPLKQTLPIFTPLPLSDNEKFQIGRMERFPIDPQSILRLPKQVSQPGIPKIQAQDPSLLETAAEKALRLERREEIRDVFKRDWDAYKRHAWMHDELRPLTNASKDPFGGWGATLVDSLDTLLIMNLDNDYKKASEAVAKIDFTYTQAHAVPLFETNIRYLGGLLAAYDLGVASGRKDPVMLEQAKKLGKLLFGAFDTPNRMPLLRYNYRLQARSADILRASKDGVMSEAGSLSVEFTRLAQLSGGEDGDRFFDAIQRITNAFEESVDSMLLPGLWPLRMDFSGCKLRRPKSKETPATSSSPKSNAPTFLKEAIHANAAKSQDSSLTKAQEATNDLIDTLHDHKAIEKSIMHEKRQSPHSQAAQAAVKAPPVEENISMEDCEVQGLRPTSATRNQIYSQGGLADSTYEYFTKEYLLLGGGAEAEQYKRLYEMSIEATKKWLLFKPLVPGDLGNDQIVMSGDVNAAPNKTPQFHGKMQHLTCFIGGMFAMGAKVFDRPADLRLAAKLTDGCVWAYDYTPSGVAPETFHLRECKEKQCKWQDVVDEVEAGNRHREAFVEAQKAAQELAAPERAEETAIDRTPQSPPEKRSDGGATLEAAALGMQNFEQSQKQKARIQAPAYVKEEASAMLLVDDRYILRPEAIESVWYMYRITGDKQWQEKGWRMWQATEKLTRTKYAHSAVSAIMTTDPPEFVDSLESFWFAETLKYYYLLFSDFETISLDDYVLNTEAHPFRRPKVAT